MRLLLGGFLVFICWQLARALWTGEWPSGRPRYRRREDPAEYWFCIAYVTAGAVLTAWLVAAPGEALREQLPWQLAFGGLLGFAAAFWLVRSLQTGSTGTSFAQTTVNRGEQPRRFWLHILGHVAVIAFAFWIVVNRPGPQPRDFYDDVEPVLAAIRRDLPPGKFAEFHNVRVDQTSRSVCGEMGSSKGARRRFFGTATSESTVVTMEGNPHADFEQGYRRLCSGTPVLPDNTRAL